MGFPAICAPDFDEPCRATASLHSPSRFSKRECPTLNHTTSLCIACDYAHRTRLDYECSRCMGTASWPPGGIYLFLAIIQKWPATPVPLRRPDCAWHPSAVLRLFAVLLHRLLYSQGLETTQSGYDTTEFTAPHETTTNTRNGAHLMASAQPRCGASSPKTVVILPRDIAGMN